MTDRQGPPPTRRGYEAFDCVSALQKAIRRSDLDGALYWSFELANSGYGAWCWKRLRIIAVEDVSSEATGLAADLAALSEQSKGDLMFLARAVIALVIAPKSRLASLVTIVHASGHVPRREIPDEALDMHTRRGKQMGRGVPHFLAEAGRLEPWTGDLDEIEAEYRDLWRRASEHDPTLPSNPWAPRNGAGLIDETAEEPGQLSLGDGGQER